MAGDAQFLISEFNALRAEIGNRTTLTYALIGLELTALGTGLTIVATTPTVVLAVSAGADIAQDLLQADVPRARAWDGDVAGVDSGVMAPLLS